MPIQFKRGDPSELALVPAQERFIGYTWRPAPDRQPITRGRYLLTPDIDLNDYHCKARLDWIDLAFETRFDTHYKVIIQSLKAALLHMSGGKGFVSSLRREEGYEGRHFIVRVQDPTPEKLARVCAHIVRRYGAVPLECGDRFLIVGVEIAIDFTPQQVKNDTDRVLARWRMSELLRKHVYLDPVFNEEDDDRPRIVGTRSRYATETRKLVQFSVRGLPVEVRTLVRGDKDLKRTVAPLSPENHCKSWLDGTFYVGRKGYEIAYRLQDKTGDRRNPRKGDFRPLPAEERRARIEVTVQRNVLEERTLHIDGGLDFLDLREQADSVGLRGVSDLARYPFETLRREFFNFQLPTMKASGGLPDAEEWDVFCRSGNYGLDLYQRAEAMVELLRWEAAPRGTRDPKPSKLRKKGRMLAYRELNAKVKRAMGRLSDEWSRFRP